MTALIYEQPLNEKTRSYLRLEHLANQLADNLVQDQRHNCFYPLFSLCELTERCDYRVDIVKDIDKQLITLEKWQQLPHADNTQITTYIEKLNSSRLALQSSQRPGTLLKENRFLSALKQRFCTPGANCNFDLPQLHFWLAKDWSERQQEYQTWINEFTQILEPVKLILQLTRNACEFEEAIAHAGFYQGDKAQALSLIRVKLDSSLGCYPTISGHKNRYAIHFVSFQHQKHSDKIIPFELAACP